jgi:Carboxypeptidase regulatory-like domain/TonB-dependent Receptor Plug Domain/TonB dependent receptor
MLARSFNLRCFRLLLNEIDFIRRVSAVCRLRPSRSSRVSQVSSGGNKRRAACPIHRRRRRIFTRRSTRLCAAIPIAVLLFLAPLSCFAQVDTGAIVGDVQDSTGAAIPGAAVTATSEGTGVKHTAVTDSAGEFILSPLSLGFYTLTFERQGFKTSVQRHIEVTIQAQLKVNVALQVGAVSQSVQVTSATPVLETQTSSMQQLVGTRSIVDLPLNRRNATFLAQLSPGVTFAQHDTRGLQASGSFSANGMDRTENDYLLDGLDNYSYIGDLVNQTQYALLPPPDALREFTVQTSNYSAEFGHSAAAVLNISTKSGTNQIHGDLWEFLRNDDFDAADYFATTGKPEFRFNQFGATLGGLVVIPHVYNGHNRTFFFVDFQGERQVQGETYDETVPTLAEHTGLATAMQNGWNLQDLITLQTGTTTDLLGRTFPKGTVMDPVTTRAVTKGSVDTATNIAATGTGYVRDPFYTGSLSGMTNFTAATAQLNQIPASRLDPVAVGILSLYPAPTKSSLTGNFIDFPNNTMSVNGGDARLDQQLGTSDSLFFRYGYQFTNQFQASPFPGVADGAPSRPGTGYTEAQNGALGWTHIFSQRVINEARLGYTRIFDKRLQYDGDVMGIPAKYGIPGIPQVSENGGLPLFDFNELSALGAANTIPSDKASDVWQVAENVTLDRGRSQIRTGFAFQRIAFPEATPSQPRGNFTSNGIYTSVVNSTDPSTDRAQAVILPQVSPYNAQQNYLGEAESVTASSFPPAFYPIRKNYGGYFEDNLRATSNLTLDLGVRYEYIGDPSERNGRFGDLIPAQTGITSDGQSHYYVPEQNISQLPMDFLNVLTANNIVLTPTSGTAIGYAQTANFAPRVGFAFQPTPKLAIRGGYGIFYQGVENRGISTAVFISFPFQVSESFSDQSAVEAIIANPTADKIPEGTVGAISEGLSNVPLTPATALVGSLQLQGEPRDPKTTYAQAYNLQFQYQIATQTILFAGYVGDNSRHVQSNIDTNTTNQITPPTTAASTIDFFPTLSTNSGNFIIRSGFSDYNGLQFGAQRRFSGGLSFMANMTWAKCMGDVHDLLDNDIGGYRAPYVTGIGMQADDTLCNIDVRRIVHTSGTYEFPFGKGHQFLQSGPASWVAGGWTMNWILTAEDGMPFSVSCAVTTASGLGCFALKVPGQKLYINKQSEFLNPNAFSDPPAVAAGTTGTIANLGGPGGQVTYPPWRRLDASIFRQFPFVRESYFQFRGEVFNITNTPNFGAPSQLTFTNPTNFSQITTTEDDPNDPREIQLSLKYYF